MQPPCSLKRTPALVHSSAEADEPVQTALPFGDVQLEGDKEGKSQALLPEWKEVLCADSSADVKQRCSKVSLCSLSLWDPTPA